MSTRLKNQLFMLLPWIVIAIAATLWLSGKVRVSETSGRESVILTRIESMGKLELVKYHIKDVVEHKLIRQWLPDPTALLIVSGEVVGCIDLTRLKKSDIHIQGDSLQIKLPKPEICYTRINHKESKVYRTEYAFWDEAQLVDEAYRAAEVSLQATAAHSDILVQTQTNAQSVLTPLFLALGFKAVHISF